MRKNQRTGRYMVVLTISLIKDTRGRAYKNNKLSINRGIDVQTV